jgi:hypothetical protein
MSNDWSKVIAHEQSESVKLMKLSLKCLVILAQKFKQSFMSFGNIWGSFAEATPALMDVFLKYLVDFKQVYLSDELRQGNQQMTFASPSVVSLILR